MPRPTPFDATAALPSETTATTSLHRLEVRQPHGVVTTGQDAYSRMESLQGRCKDDNDEQVRNAPLSVTAG